MSNLPDQRDLVPNTPTAAALRSASRDAIELRQPGGDPKRREIEIDPDAPNAPVCTKPKYITVDPDAPDAPTCKPKRYIVAPEPGTLRAKPLPDWARQLGDDLSESFGDRA